MNKNSILIIGDSTSLPREEVKYICTWPYLIQKLFPTFTIENNSMWGNTTGCLEGKNSLEWYNPEIVIIQLGIVDCAPRLLSNFERKILSALPSRVGKGYSIINKLFRKRSLKKAYISANQFKKNIENFISRAENIDVRKIFFISILDSGEKYANKNPKAQEAIDMYNNILINCIEKSDICEFVKIKDINEKVDEHTLKDGFHYNDIGHGLVCLALKERIENYIKISFSKTEEIHE